MVFTKGDFALPSLPGTFGNVWGNFLTVTAVGQGATGIYWVEARDTAAHPTIHRTAFQQERII